MTEAAGDSTNSADAWAPDLKALADVTPRTWSSREVTLLGQWQQGYLVECPPMAWAVAPDEAGGGVAASSHEVKIWRSPAPFAVVLTQTCDVVAEGPGQRAPFVQVSPVIDASAVPDSKWKQIQKGEIVDRFALSPVELEGRWLADLRISMPVDKRYLLEKSPKNGFSTETELLRFGDHLAARLQRPALHDFLTDVVIREIDKQLRDGVKAASNGWCVKVSEVCLLIRGSRLAPRDVRLLVLCDDGLDPSERERWVSLSKTFEKRARDEGFSMSLPQVKKIDECPASVYRLAVPMRLTALGPQRELDAPPLA